MRIFPVLALVVFLIPPTLNAGMSRGTGAQKDGIAMCREQWGFVERAARVGDSATLKGLLLPDGVSLFSPDGSISRAALQQAADAWNRSLGESAVRLATGAKDANVSIKKADGIDGGEQQGEIVVFRADDGSLSANVLVDSQGEDHLLTDREVGAVVTHEIGHYLGLDDLTGRARIMGEFDSTHLVVRPSSEEASAVIELRRRIGEAIHSLDRQPTEKPR